jgi:hypothetical protein
VVQRLFQLAFEPTHGASEVRRADLTQLRVEDHSVGMAFRTSGERRDAPSASGGLERELTSEEHIGLLKARNAKAREAINALVAENARLRVELGGMNDESVGVSSRTYDD